MNDVYDYHHYHSSLQEVLGISRGQATLMFGSLDGCELTVQAGDMVVIPAGIAHCRKQASGNFEVVGAYLSGQEKYNLCREDMPLQAAWKNIYQVANRITDSLFGPAAPLPSHSGGRFRAALT